MPAAPKPESSRSEPAAARDLAADYQKLRAEIAKVIVGHVAVVEQLLTSLFARGRVLLVGVPGLTKTLLVSTVAHILSLSFRRIQFTPDMMPSDIAGTDTLQDDPDTGRRKLMFIEGPVFARTILAHEVNRNPPKARAALLETMQEKHVNAAGRTYPFFVLAAHNPNEQEGACPLPEAKLDHFMMNISFARPNTADEFGIFRATAGDASPAPEVMLSAEQILALQSQVRRVPIAGHVFIYICDLARPSRPDQTEAIDQVRKHVS